MNFNLDRYRRYFSEGRFWAKLRKHASSAGQQAVYTALLLYYAYRRPQTPKWAKRVVLGTLGYLLMPIDAIPDLSPIIGFTDDAGLLSVCLATIAAYVNDDVRTQARNRLSKWFPEPDAKLLDRIDQKK